MNCPIIDGMMYHRWTMFMANNSVKLLLHKGTWSPFQVKFTMVLTADISSIGQTPAMSDSQQGYLMSHDGFRFNTASAINNYHGNLDVKFGVNGIPRDTLNWLTLDWIFLDIGTEEKCSNITSSVDRFSIHYDDTQLPLIYSCSNAKLSRNMKQVLIPIHEEIAGFYFQFKSQTQSNYRGFLLKYAIVSCPASPNAHRRYNFSTECVTDSSAPSANISSTLRTSAPTNITNTESTIKGIDRIKQFFEKTDNIIAVSCGAAGLLLLIIIIVLAVKVAKSFKRSPKAGGQLAQELQGVEDMVATGEQTAGKSDDIGSAMNNYEPVPGNAVNSSGGFKVATQDLYAPIIKAKKPDTNIDMVDNDLYGS